MTSSRTVACLLLAAVSLSCRPVSDQVLTADERRAVADTIGLLFNEIPDATNALDFDRLLGYYRDSEDLTYVARGRVTRSYRAFAELLDAQFRGVTEADLRWMDTYVDVLSRDIAVATATYEFTAILEARDTAQSAGTFMGIYVLRDGNWQIEYSAHSFPLARR